MTQRTRPYAKIRGVKLEPVLFKVEQRDDLGRPTYCRMTYSEEKLFEVLSAQERRDASAEFLLVWIASMDIRPQTKGDA